MATKIQEPAKVNKGVRFTPSTWQQIGKVAIDRNENRSALINRIIEEWLATNEKRSKAAV